jgi:hypothetical protein
MMFVAAAALVLFLIPGYAWVSWLHATDRLEVSTRLALGWGWSFAAFSAVAGPFLWLQGGAPAYLTALGALWIVVTPLTGWLYARSFRRAKEVAVAAPVPRPARPGSSDQPRRGAMAAVAVAGLYAVLVGVVLKGWSPDRPDRSLQERMTILFPLILLLGVLLALGLHRFSASLLRFGPEDEAAPPRYWSALAAVLIGLQAVGAVAYGRPDWDDCYYLAAALDYQEGQVLNDQEPTHRESYPVQAIYRLMTWELWGGTLGRLSGLGPLVVFHSVLPGLLVLASYAAYRAVLGEILARRWVPLALIGLSGFHLWGISNLGNASNHFLIRIWQGKAVLLHVGLPLTTFALIRFARQPVLRWWLTLCACLLCGPGWSSSAIFLSVCLVGCLVPLWLLTVPPGKRLAFAAGSYAALAPTVGVGLLFWLAVRGDAAFHPELDRTWWQGWFFEWDRYSGNGSAEIVWLATLPLLWVLLADWRSRLFLIGLPALLLLTFANPLLQSAVATQLTGAVAYSRLFWLFPEGLALAVLLALVSRLAARTLGGVLGVGGSWLPLSACVAGLGISAALPGIWVWGSENSAGPFMVPQPAENLERMPLDLKVIAGKLAGDPDIDEKRIVCREEVASFLTPYSRRFRFVATRRGYTMYDVGKAHGSAEAAERVFLADALWDPLFQRLTDDGLQMIVRIAGAGSDSPRPDPWPTQENLSNLLDRYNVGYAVASPVVADTARERSVRARLRDNNLRRTGFRVVYEGKGGYALWVRDSRTAGDSAGGVAGGGTDKAP